MNEWAKAAISTFLGFIAGLLAEPLKAHFEGRRKLQLVRRLLYRDLANVEYAMTALASRQDLAAYLAAPQGELRFADLQIPKRIAHMGPFRIGLVQLGEWIAMGIGFPRYLL